MASVDRSAMEHWTTVEAWPLPAALAAADRIDTRRAALLRLDPLVRRQLQRPGTALALRIIELTAYDEIYAGSPEVGGHWTAATPVFGLFAHSINAISVALLFDEQDRPRRFQVSGARTVLSVDASEAALSSALDEVLAAGPAISTAPHVFQSLGI